MADDIYRLRTQVDASILRAALVAIQELHKPRFIGTQEDGTTIYACMLCLVDDNGTCKTRRLADDALTARTTKNGDNND